LKLCAHSFKERVVFQSVRMLTTMSRFEAWKDDSTRQTEFVVIGRNLDQKAFQTGLESCIAG
jgi:G3E family GTPase